MSNKVYNFQLPRFHDEKGTDWQGFKDVMEENYDHYFNKVIDLYSLIDLDKMSDNAVSRMIDSWGVPLIGNEDALGRRKKLRGYVERFSKKGLPDIYIEEAKVVTGLDGEFRPGKTKGWKWGTSRWATSPPTGVDEIRWSDIPAGGAKFVVYFDAKTTDSGELDQIQAIFRKPFLLPAYYKIFIVDASDVILREV